MNKNFKKYSYIVYGALTLIAIICFTFGALWAEDGKKVEEIVYETATVNVDENVVRKEYIMGEPINLDGVSLAATDGDETFTPEQAEWKVEVDTATAGTKPVVISWQNGNVVYRGCYEITVYAIRHIDIRPMGLETKLVYGVDETQIDKSGIEIWADLSSAPKTNEFEKPTQYDTVIKLKPEQFTITANELGKPGIHWATVQCGQVAGGFNYAVEGVAIDTSQAATVYGVGETFMPAGIGVTVTSKANRTQDNLLGTNYVGGYSYSTPDMTKLGAQSVKITYGDAEADYNITLYRQAFVCTGIKAGNPNTTDCTVNFYWTKGATTANEGQYKVSWKDSSGVRHAQTATWGHYDNSNITMWAYNGVVDTCSMIYGENKTVYNWDSSNPKWYFESTASGEFSLVYPYAQGDVIYAKANLSDIEAIRHGVDVKSLVLNTDECQKVFEKKDKFSFEGLKVTAELWNGGQRELEASEYRLSTPAFNDAGIKTITVSYGAPTDGNKYDMVTSSYQITVKGYALNVEGIKTVFYNGETFNFDNAEVYYYDENGATLCTETLTLDKQIDTTVSGEKKVSLKATYNETDYTFNYNIIVLPQDFTLQIDYSKSDNAYVVGETFSAEGIKVSAVYDEEGFSAQVMDYQVIAPDTSTIGVKQVQVSYMGVSATYTIYVIPDVPWETHKMDFGNAQNNGDILELFITERPTSTDSTQDSTSKGWYLLRKANGEIKMFEMTYNYTASGWQSEFITDGLDEYVDNNDGGNLKITIDGTTFVSGAAYWHQRIIGWNE